LSRSAGPLAAPFAISESARGTADRLPRVDAVTDYEPAFQAYERLKPIDPSAAPVAILVAGVPGAGKSTLAEGLARELRAAVFSMDWQLGALTPFRVLTNENLTPLAEMMVVGALARQLQLGLDVVLDVTGHEVEARERYRRVAESLGARFVGVECVCSDADVHRSRVEGRDRGIPGWRPSVPWEHVLRMQGLWEIWPEPHLVLDSAKQDAETSLKQALGEVATARVA
jgi:predicted kinase